MNGWKMTPISSSAGSEAGGGWTQLLSPAEPCLVNEGQTSRLVHRVSVLTVTFVNKVIHFNLPPPSTTSQPATREPALSEIATALAPWSAVWWTEPTMAK